MLITDEYRALNAQMHADKNSYGAGSFRWAQAIMDAKEELGANTVLDYGCGKGTLRYALGDPYWLKEYDPAIAGKDQDPDEADLIVCTDVLEHVERENLLNVLEHLRQLARRGLFLVIATRPSSKTLPDGRNAHLIVEDAAWWKVQLGRFFKFLDFTSTEGELRAVCRRLHMIGDIQVISAVSDSIRYEQAVRNLSVCKRRLYMQPRHEKAVSIVCYGPSLHQSWLELHAERARGNMILTVSGAHDFCLSRGIVPDIHVDVDPREHKGFFTKTPHRDVKYWMGSCCHPKVIDNLLGYDLSLWNIFNSDEDARLLELEPDGFILAGGGSVGCRAVNLMYTQGYRRFYIHGMDCSFADDGEQHAGPHSGKVQQEWQVTCNGKPFKTSGTLVAIAKSFIDNQNALDTASKENGEPLLESGYRIDTLLHGDGLLKAMAIAGAPRIEDIAA